MDAIKELKNLKNLDKNDLLEALGLQPKQETLDQVVPALGIFAAGLLLGTGLGLLMAPKPGRTLRRQLRRGASDMVDRAQEAAAELRPGSGR